MSSDRIPAMQAAVLMLHHGLAPQSNLMPYRPLTFFFACAFVAVAAMRGQAPTAKMPPGLVLAAKVSGMVTMTVNDTTTDLNLDAKVPPAARINTGAESSAVLVFSNSATMQLGADTELVLQEFLQDPFAAPVNVAQLVAEPSRSRTVLALNRGELVGNVKKLNLDRGSSFTVKTGVGTADISCGTFLIAFRPTGAGQALFTLSTQVCEIGFTQPTGGGGTAAGAGTRLAIPPGREIKITVTVNGNAPGQLVPVSPRPPTNAAKEDPIH